MFGYLAAVPRVFLYCCEELRLLITIMMTEKNRSNEENP